MPRKLFISIWRISLTRQIYFNGKKVMNVTFKIKYSELFNTVSQ